MSSYPEPDNQQHYTLYPPPGQQPLLDPVQQEQLQFSQLGQAIYPKIEGEIDPNAPNHIEQRIEQLQQQSPLPQSQHQHQHQHQHQQVPLAPPPPPPTAAPQGPPVQGETPQKANRLRKACDSCSIRKVKVSRATSTVGRIVLLISSSVMNLVLRVGLALLLTFLVLLNDPAVDEALPIAMPKPSSVAALRNHHTCLASLLLLPRRTQPKL